MSYHQSYDGRHSAGGYAQPNAFTNGYAGGYQPNGYATSNGYGGNKYANDLNVDVIEGVYRPIPQRSPLTKQVNQLAYEIPKNKYASNPWNYAPEFLKVFGDVRTHVGGRAIFDCVLLGSPRPKVCWLFNDDKIQFTDIQIEDTADICRLIIPYVQPHHYGTYTVLCENEVGRAVTTANLVPL